MINLHLSVRPKEQSDPNPSPRRIEGGEHYAACGRSELTLRTIWANRRRNGPQGRGLRPSPRRS